MHTARNTNTISLITLLILFYVTWRVATLYPRWDNAAAEATISWDVFGYYLYLPAYVIYDDLGGLKFVDEIFATYQPAGDFHHAVAQPDGRYVMKYPIGMALLYFPLFLIGHMVALLSDFPADGFSRPYQVALSWGSIVYAWIGLALIRKVLLTYVSDKAVAICLGVLVLATNYLNYVSFDGAMPHNYLFAVYAGILLLTMRWHENPSTETAVGIGLLVGLATIIRPIELMAILIPLLWTVKDRETFLEKWEMIQQRKRDVLGLVIGMIVMGAIQLIYWKIYSGQFFYYSYGEYGFDWLNPHLYHGLLSARKGWLTYTPVMIFALIGFIPLYKYYRSLFGAILIFILINIYVVYSWEVWWYGGSFGSRAMIQAYAVLAIPFAILIEELIKMKSVLWKVLAFGSMLLCADLNLIQTWQAHDSEGGWRADGMTRKYYWKIFGTTRPKKADKKFLDTRHELTKLKGKTLDTLYYNNFEQDTTAFTTAQYVYEGAKSLVLDGAHQFSPTYERALNDIATVNGGWIRVSAKTMYTAMEWVEWQQCQFITEFVRDGEVYKRTGVRIQRLANPWQWHSLHYELPIPDKAKPGDKVKVYFWNSTGQQAVYVDDWRVEWIYPA